jgi:hypothetical protein
MLRKIYRNTLGNFSFTSAPATCASPHIAITSHKVNQITEGVRGITPFGCLPHGGKEGITFVFF